MVIFLLLWCGSAWAKEDCNKFNFGILMSRSVEQQCRIANALEEIAGKMK